MSWFRHREPSMRLSFLLLIIFSVYIWLGTSGMGMSTKWIIVTNWVNALISIWHWHWHRRSFFFKETAYTCRVPANFMSQLEPILNCKRHLGGVFASKLLPLYQILSIFIISPSSNCCWQHDQKCFSCYILIELRSNAEVLFALNLPHSTSAPANLVLV